MSYLVLARKWRPQNFDDLVGQEHVGRTLKNAISIGRVHHAFLFTGARGVGKTSAARIFAKALNCETGPTEMPCNQCAACTEITAGRSSDVFEIDGASNTGVDDIRDLRENIRYLPSSSRYKIFIIDEVHMLSINAFNALLKTLEEPPAHAKFIFATTEPHKIPITILSRTQRFDFRKITLPKIVERLRLIVDAEGVTVSDRSLALVARQGEGSMRDSLSAMDQIIAFCGLNIADDEVQGLLGMVDRRLLLEGVEAILQRDSYRVLDLVRRIDNLGHSFRRFSQELVDQFRSLLILKVVEEPGELLDLTDSERRELAVMGQGASQEDLQRIINLLLRAEVELATSSFPRLSLEMAMVRLSQLPESRDLASLVRKLEGLEGRITASGFSAAAKGQRSAPGPGASPAAAAAPRVTREPRAPVVPMDPPMPEDPPAPAEPQLPDSLPQLAADKPRSWEAIVAHVRSTKASTASLLEHGSLLTLNESKLELGYAVGSFYLTRMSDPDMVQILEVLVSECLGRPISIKIVALARQPGKVAPPTLLQEKKVRQQGHQQELRQEALDHPMVKKALEVLGGEVIQVKPLEAKVEGIESPESNQAE